MNKKLGYGSSASLRAAYPKFFWSTVAPYIGNALSNLRMTQEGKLWIANLYSHVFAEEHKLPTFGAERMRDSVATANPVGWLWYTPTICPG